MKFQVLDILPNLKNPVTGREIRADERYSQALTSARHAEQFGFDAVGLGERHAGAFLSSGVTVLLGAIAATTSRVRIQTGVSVLSIHDPLRVAEDYATVDRSHAAGSSSSPARATKCSLAAKWGDPLFSANAIQPRDRYTVRIDHYRTEYVRHGHDPRFAYIGAGAGLYLADTTQEAKKAFGPTYEQIVAYFNQPGNHTPGNETTFAAIDDAVERGPVLVGSPQQIAEKILWFHEAFGHDLQSFSLPTVIPHEQQHRHARTLRERGHSGGPQGCPDDSVERRGPVRCSPRRPRPDGPRCRHEHRPGAALIAREGGPAKYTGVLRAVACSGGSGPHRSGLLDRNRRVAHAATRPAFAHRRHRRHRQRRGDLLRGTTPRGCVSLEGADHLLTTPGQAQRAAHIISAWDDQYIHRSRPKGGVRGRPSPSSPGLRIHHERHVFGGQFAAVVVDEPYPHGLAGGT
ncbi:LLM class flavin-dependent oxidoreductase [Streptomyces sp. NPDC004393]